MKNEGLISYQNDDQEILGFLTTQIRDVELSLNEKKSDGLNGSAIVLLDFVGCF